MATPTNLKGWKLFFSSTPSSQVFYSGLHQVSFDSSETLFFKVKYKNGDLFDYNSLNCSNTSEGYDALFIYREGITNLAFTRQGSTYTNNCEYIEFFADANQSDDLVSSLIMFLSNYGEWKKNISLIIKNNDGTTTYSTLEGQNPLLTLQFTPSSDYSSVRYTADFDGTELDDEFDLEKVYYKNPVGFSLTSNKTELGENDIPLDDNIYDVGFDDDTILYVVNAWNDRINITFNNNGVIENAEQKYYVPATKMNLSLNEEGQLSVKIYCDNDPVAFDTIVLNAPEEYNIIGLEANATQYLIDISYGSTGRDFDLNIGENTQFEILFEDKPQASIIFRDYQGNENHITKVYIPLKTFKISKNGNTISVIANNKYDTYTSDDRLIGFDSVPNSINIGYELDTTYNVNVTNSIALYEVLNNLSAEEEFKRTLDRISDLLNEYKGTSGNNTLDKMVKLAGGDMSLKGDVIDRVNENLNRLVDSINTLYGSTSKKQLIDLIPMLESLVNNK